MGDWLYSRDEIRELDRLAIEEQGIPGLVLMRRAAEAAYQTLIANWPEASSVSILCGSGNNAGDGYILAGLLAQRGIVSEAIMVGSTDKLGADATSAYEYCQCSGAVLKEFDSSLHPGADLLVDALLGTGLKGAAKNSFLKAINIINDSGKPVLSLDIPSGLCADTGSVQGACVRAAVTVTFIGLKRGQLTAEGPQVCGNLVLDDLGLSPKLLASVQSNVCKLDLQTLKSQISRRHKNAHKGMFGHLLVVGGDESMPGSVTLASEAALRIGTGLVTLATRAQHIDAVIARRPEVMVKAVEGGEQLKELLDNVSAVVIGPGLGKSDWSLSLFKAVLKSDLPLIVDADALNLLAELFDSKSNDDLIVRNNWILTPHPGEAGRLLNKGTKDVQADRFSSVVELQSKFGGIAVLKGAGTLIGAQDSHKEKGNSTNANQAIKTSLCAYGNPGMATAGMGDVLSGVIGGMVAQGYPLKFAAEFGVCLHSKAADDCVDEGGEKGLLAADLMPFIRRLLNSFVSAD